MKHTPIGIDLGRTRVSCAQLAQRGGGWMLAHAVRFERSGAVEGGAGPGELTGGEARRLMEVLARHGFEGDEVVLGLPLEKQLSVVAELPSRSTGAPVELLAREELAKAARVPASRVQCACWALPGTPPGGRGRGETESVMVMGCLAEHAEGLLEPMLAAGARVRALDARSLALARYVGAGESWDALRGGVWALLDIDLDATFLAMVVNGTVVYERALPEGSVSALVERLKARLRLDAGLARCVLEVAAERADAPQVTRGGEGEARAAVHEFIHDLAGDVQASVQYAAQRFGGEGGARVRLRATGQLALTPHLPARLAERLGLDREASSFAARMDPAFALAAGLALHDLPSARLDHEARAVTDRWEGVPC